MTIVFLEIKRHTLVASRLFADILERLNDQTSQIQTAIIRMRDDILNMPHEPIVVNKLAFNEQCSSTHNLLFLEIFNHNGKVFMIVRLEIIVAIYDDNQ